MGHPHGRKRWMTADRVTNAPLREAFLASPMTLSDVCHRLGWVRSDGSSKGAETSRLKRGLGIEATKNRMKETGHVSETFVATIEIVKAKAICDVLGVDFDELYPDLPTTRARGGRCVSCGESLLRPVADQTCGFCIEETAFAESRAA
jgi:hypothetical protein